MVFWYFNMYHSNSNWWKVTDYLWGRKRENISSATGWNKDPMSCVRVLLPLSNHTLSYYTFFNRFLRRTWCDIKIFQHCFFFSFLLPAVFLNKRKILRREVAWQSILGTFLWVCKRLGALHRWGAWKLEHVNFTSYFSYCELIDCSQLIRLLLVSLMYNNLIYRIFMCKGSVMLLQFKASQDGHILHTEIILSGWSTKWKTYVQSIDSCYIKWPALYRPLFKNMLRHVKTKKPSDPVRSKLNKISKIEKV